jgi:hypothetical protein
MKNKKPGSEYMYPSCCFDALFLVVIKRMPLENPEQPKDICVLSRAALALSVLGHSSTPLRIPNL